LGYTFLPIFEIMLHIFAIPHFRVTGKGSFAILTVAAMHQKYSSLRKNTSSTIMNNIITKYMTKIYTDVKFPFLVKCWSAFPHDTWWFT